MASWNVLVVAGVRHRPVRTIPLSLFAPNRPRLSCFYSQAAAAAAAASAATTTTATVTAIKPPASPPPLPPPPSSPRNLSILTWKALLRSLAVLSVASLPRPVLSTLIRHSKWIERSAIMKPVLRATFYKHFCLGEANADILHNMDEVRQMGVRGVILGFAREQAEPVTVANKTARQVLTDDDGELKAWLRFNLDTIDKLRPGDYLAVRCTGGGRNTVNMMNQYFDFTRAAANLNGPDTAQVLPQLDVFCRALHEICAAAEARGIRILVDAELVKHQVAIDHVVLQLMSTFNKNEHAVVFGTHQMYLKSAISKLQAQLRHAAKNNFVLGVKLVRGAYMHSEPDRNLIHDSKNDTDKAYDEAARLLISSTTNTTENAGTADDKTPAGWSADLMLATHNVHSAREALDLYRHVVTQTRMRHETFGLRSLGFAQLKGMADELSLQLAAEIEHLQKMGPDEQQQQIPAVGVYKATIWGSVHECLAYMVRRAEENKDAVARSRATARAMVREVFRRLVPIF